MIWPQFWYPTPKDEIALLSKVVIGNLVLVIFLLSPPASRFFPPIKQMLSSHQKEIKVLKHSPYIQLRESLSTAVKDSLAWKPGVLAMGRGVSEWIAAQAVFLVLNTAAPSWSLGLGHSLIGQDFAIRCQSPAICPELPAGELPTWNPAVILSCLCSPGFPNEPLSQLHL